MSGEDIYMLRSGALQKISFRRIYVLISSIRMGDPFWGHPLEPALGVLTFQENNI